MVHCRAVSADLPVAFQKVFADLVEMHVSSGAGEAFRRCFGCGPAHPSGLRVRVFKTDDGVLSPVVVSRQYEGPPGAAHGGIVAAYLDEILGGAVVCATGIAAVTGELTIRYARPVPTETPLLGRGRLVNDHGRYVDVEGSLEELGTARVVATARGRFFPFATTGTTPAPAAS
jgi:acyl-coenzyme A thioesterase PaaI-like protein